MSANEKGIIAVTGRAHCQRQVAFLPISDIRYLYSADIRYPIFNIGQITTDIRYPIFCPSRYPIFYQYSNPKFLGIVGYQYSNPKKINWNLSQIWTYTYKHLLQNIRQENFFHNYLPLKILKKKLPQTFSICTSHKSHKNLLYQ